MSDPLAKTNFDKVDRALELHVIDWLQFAQFPEDIRTDMDDSDMAQLTLTLLAKRKQYTKDLEKELEEMREENRKLKAAKDYSGKFRVSEGVKSNGEVNIFIRSDEGPMFVCSIQKQDFTDKLYKKALSAAHFLVNDSFYRQQVTEQEALLLTCLKELRTCPLARHLDLIEELTETTQGETDATESSGENGSFQKGT